MTTTTTTPAALAIIEGLLTKYSIEDPDQAHRLIRERFTQEDLDTYREALTALDDAGDLG